MRQRPEIDSVPPVGARGLLERLKQALAGLLRPAKPMPAAEPPSRPYAWEAAYPEGLSWDRRALAILARVNGWRAAS